MSYCQLKFYKHVDVFPIKVGVLTGNYNLTPLDYKYDIPIEQFQNISGPQALRRKQNKCNSCQPCKCIHKNNKPSCSICDC